MSRISFNSSIESMSTQEIRAVRDEFSRLQRVPISGERVLTGMRVISDEESRRLWEARRRPDGTLPPRGGVLIVDDPHDPAYDERSAMTPERQARIEQWYRTIGLRNTRGAESMSEQKFYKWRLSCEQVADMHAARVEAKADPTKCVRPPYGCGKPIAPDSFRDELSRQEHASSGLCQSCQDSIFEDDSALGLPIAQDDPELGVES